MRQMTAILYALKARYHSRFCGPDAADLLVVGEQGVDRERGGMAGDADGLHPQHFQPADVGEGIADRGHLPVEHRAHFATREGEVARFGVAVHQGDRRAWRGPVVAQRPMQPFQGGQRVALDPVHLRGPVAEFPVEMLAAIIERVEPGLGRGRPNGSPRVARPCSRTSAPRCESATPAGGCIS